LLGTEVICRSRPGRGSVFEFSLPLAARKAQEEPDSSKRGAIQAGVTSGDARRRIVVVEDDLMVARAIAVSLASLGMSVSCHGNAEDALAHSRIGDADFYISDFRLPGLNGIEFLNALARRSARPVRGVLLTGDTSAERIAITKSSPWPVLFKPVDLTSLIAAINLCNSDH
jgi:DNA-binding NtrC family response regulator